MRKFIDAIISLIATLSGLLTYLAGIVAFMAMSFVLMVFGLLMVGILIPTPWEIVWYGAFISILIGAMFVSGYAVHKVFSKFGVWVFGFPTTAYGSSVSANSRMSAWLVIACALSFLALAWFSV